MDMNISLDSGQLTDAEIIERLQESSETEQVFSATSEWSLEKVRRSIQSRGDYFDREACVVFVKDGKAILMTCMCNLPVTIGSSTKADCRLDYEGISRVHCRLEAVGNLMRLYDEDSKNGTRLNGKPIEYEDLCDGDELEIGSISVRVKRI